MSAAVSYTTTAQAQRPTTTWTLPSSPLKQQNKNKKINFTTTATQEEWKVTILLFFSSKHRRRKGTQEKENKKKKRKEFSKVSPASFLPPLLQFYNKTAFYIHHVVHTQSLSQYNQTNTTKEKLWRIFIVCNTQAKSRTMMMCK